jgi:hypothetical protein
MFKIDFGAPMLDLLRADLKELITSSFSKNSAQLDTWIDMEMIKDLAHRHLSGEDYLRTLWPF